MVSPCLVKSLTQAMGSLWTSRSSSSHYLHNHYHRYHHDHSDHQFMIITTTYHRYRRRCHHFRFLCRLLLFPASFFSSRSSSSTTLSLVIASWATEAEHSGCWRGSFSSSGSPILPAGPIYSVVHPPSFRGDSPAPWLPLPCLAGW